MKRFLASFLLILVLSGTAGAGTSPSYINYGVVTTPPVVDATVFANLGVFNISLVTTTTNLGVGLGTLLSGIPYSTRDTLYFTNENTMTGSPGFWFDTVSATKRASANTFYNSGTLTGVDFPGAPFVILGTGAGAISFPSYSFPLPSQLLVDATNIINQGTMAVGSVGLIKLNGKNVNLSNGALKAGAVSDTDTEDLTGQGSTSFEIANNVGFVIDPPEIYDLWWGATNGETLFLPWNPPFQPVADFVGVRGYAEFAGLALPINSPANFEPFVYLYATDPEGTNLYFNMVFVNTNFVDQTGKLNTNITASVRFTDSFEVDQIPIGDPNGIESVVQFSEPILDAVSGQLVTNAVYFMDSGAAINPMSTNLNAQYTTGYARPNTFSIATATPFDWEFSFPANTSYDPGSIYAGGSFVNNKVTMTNSSYAAIIGRNPENVDGAFDLGPQAFGLALSSGSFDLPDMTNEPARVEVNANYLNIDNMRMRAEGVITLNGSNVVGNPAATDWGNINANLAVTNGTLLLSNIFPASFNRIRGDIYAWGVNWLNVYTNGVTNTIHYHVLILDQNLNGSFRPSVRNLNLQATNVVVVDPLRVIQNDVFRVANLTISNAVTLTQNAGNMAATNIPNLQHLFIGTNGSLSVDSLLNLGYPVSLSQSTPVNRKYLIQSITNLGSITATAPLLQARAFENDGTIFAANGGSMVINANTLGLSQAGVNETVLVLTNTYVVGQTNFLLAGANITISAASVTASNSLIQAGLSGFGSLDLSVTGNLTDRVPSTPTTNNVLVNFWQTTGGFSLLTKPATGDLFGTQIKSIVAGNNVASHVWAGVDYGPKAAGFSNNAVIGRLILDRQTDGAVMQFSGAGTKNAMYVDYLELDDASYSDYRHGLQISPNLTIYFADSTADPIKLEQTYPGRLVWVPEFTGPNSTTLVPYIGGGYCLMNAGLAHSPDISSADDGVPNAYSPYPLNNLTNGDVIPCPSGVTIMKAFIAQGSGSPGNLILSAYGDGTVSPELETGTPLVIGQTYTFTATPNAGWLFDGWTGTYPTSGSTVSFTMQSEITNVNLTAHFIANPFPAVAGSYNGLFSVASAVTANSSGFFTFNVNANGAFSGKLQIGAGAYGFTGQFNANGVANVTAKNGSTSLALSLQLDTTDKAGKVSGSVGGAQWSASLQGDRAPVWTAGNPAPQQGHYTLLLPGVADESTLPAGDSYGSVTVSASGSLTFVGNLADGTAISQAVPVSQSGQWPFYASGAGGKDTVLGWVSFASDGSGFDGNVTWLKAPSATPYYPSGFSLEQELSGARYTPPSARASALSLRSHQLVLSGGNLGQTFTTSVASRTGLTYTDASGRVILNINPATGGFSGSIAWPGTHGKVPIGGVVNQSDDSAAGFFLGTTQSGAVQLQGN